MKCKNYSRWNVLCQECSMLDKPNCGIKVKKCNRCNQNVEVDRFVEDSKFCIDCQEEMSEVLNQ